MGDDSIAEAGASARAEIHHAFGDSNFFKKLDELGGDGGRIARWLQDYGVATHDRGYGHAGHNGAGKIPWRNNRANAEGNVSERIVLAGQLHRGLSLGQAQSFASIEFAEVDGLGDIGVGLAPVLADLENQPGHVIHFALAQEGGARNSRLARSSTAVFFHDANALSAAFMAGSTCSL